MGIGVGENVDRLGREWVGEKVIEGINLCYNYYIFLIWLEITLNILYIFFLE